MYTNALPCFICPIQNLVFTLYAFCCIWQFKCVVSWMFSFLRQTFPLNLIKIQLLTKKDQLAPSAFRGIIGYANAFSRKYLDNEQQINANTKTAIKQSRDVKLSLQNYHCSTTLATTPVPATTTTIMSTVGKYFEWLCIHSVMII